MRFPITLGPEVVGVEEVDRTGENVCEVIAIGETPGGDEIPLELSCMPLETIGEYGLADIVMCA